MRGLIKNLVSFKKWKANSNDESPYRTNRATKIRAIKSLIIALLLLLAIQLVVAEPLIISAKVRPENPSVGDTIGIYITILGQQDESVQVFTKLKNSTFKVVDILTKENVPYSAIKSDTIDFKVSKGQTVEITIIGEMPKAKTLAVLFPNAYRVEVKEITPNSSPTPTKAPESNPIRSDKEELWKKYGELYAKYERLKDTISERLQLIIEEKFRIANSKLEAGQLEDAKTILNEVEGLLTVPEPDNWSAIMVAVILVAIGSIAILVWKYYQPNKQRLEEEEEIPVQTNFRLWR